MREHIKPFILPLFLLALMACQATGAATPTPSIPLPASSPATRVPASPLAVPSPSATAIALVDLKGRALKVGSDTAYPPFESINDKKEIVGFDVDLVNEICKRIDCKATFITADFDTLLAAVNNQTYDLSVSGWTITPERARLVDFSLPYLPNAQVLLVRNDEARLKEVTDLKNGTFIVAAQFGTPNASALRKLVADPGKQVKEFPDDVAAIQALLNRQVDAVVVSAFAAVDWIDQNKGKIKSTGKPFGDDALGMVFRKGDTELKSAFDAGLKAIYQDGTWSKLCTQWWKDAALKPDCAGATLPLGK